MRAIFSLALAGAALANTEEPERRTCEEGCVSRAPGQQGYELLQKMIRLQPTPRFGAVPAKTSFKDTTIMATIEKLEEERKPTPRFGLQVGIQMVANYGCWCYPWSQWDTGLGRSWPRDEHDDACKAHSMGMKCIAMDAKVENKECQPYDTSYKFDVHKDGYGNLLLECSDDIEEEWCQRRVCMVELRRLARYWHLIDQQVYPDYSKWLHPQVGGPFDPIVNCESGPGVEPIEAVCCGDYPYRTWFYRGVNDHSKGNTRCCAYEDPQVTEDYGFYISVGALYDKRHQTCTADGPVNKK